ncbi:MAG: adenylate kinase family protein, partial [Rhodanobacteraceae bacterium]
DGYPRNLAQANALDELLARLARPLDAVVKLTVPDAAIVKRCELRFEEEHRADDNPDTVRKRLAVYARETAPVADSYAQRGLLTEVDGVGAIEAVSGRVLAALRSRVTS